jgi:molybdate transport system regulatory protein
VTKPAPLPRSQIQVRLKLKIGEDSIGPGKAALLKKIREHGSISAAARDMGINYRRAWFLLETVNSALGQPVVKTEKGGKDGGGARLTAAGEAVLEAFEACRQEADTGTRGLLNDLHARLAKGNVTQT